MREKCFDGSEERLLGTDNDPAVRLQKVLISLDAYHRHRVPWEGDNAIVAIVSSEFEGAFYRGRFPVLELLRFVLFQAVRCFHVSSKCLVVSTEYIARLSRFG